MLKRPFFISITLIAVIVMVLFRVKYEVIALEAAQKHINTDITKNQEALRVLRTEWNLLNEPSRLQKLCAKYLPNLQPINSTQLVTFQDMIQVKSPTSQETNLDAFMASVIEQEINTGSKT